MIDSIEIRNYRNLNELKINSFARVNLITGKNNVGKSSLLEAIIIYVSKADLRVIYELLNDRGENYFRNSNRDNVLETNIKTFSSLFSSRETSGLVSIATNENNPVSIRFVKYIEKEVPGEYDGEPTTKRIAIEDADNNISDAHYGIEINNGVNLRIRPLERNYPILKNKSIENFQYIRARNMDNEINGILWDNITLTKKETFVLEALKIIEPNIDRIAFIQESSMQRTTVIKLKNDDTIIPMMSMGDGINRIFSIILAMVNAENGYLFIDEFENGLHYTVQRKLWDLIFKLSDDLKIQVFITTHSLDSINSFEFVLNNTEDKSIGKFIRLDNKKGQIKEVEFTAKELETATGQNIEIR